MNYLSSKQLYKTEMMYSGEGQKKNSCKSSGREGEVMWKSCSRATKPLLQIKLNSSKEGVRPIQGEKARRRE